MARFTNGWVKAWRKAAESDLADNMYLWGLWHWLLYAATWKPTKKMIAGEQKILPAGSVVFTPKEISARWNCSESVVRKWLKYLHDTQRVVVEPCGRGTVVTICNWAAYQGGDVEPSDDREDVVREPSAERARGECLIEEVKKGRREEIYECVAIWGETLSRMGVKKSPKLDEAEIAKLVARYGLEKTALALLGAGFEAKSEHYDPAKHVSIRRLTSKPDVFEKFVNLGAQHRPAERDAAEWLLPKAGGA